MSDKIKPTSETKINEELPDTYTNAKDCAQIVWKVESSRPCLRTLARMTKAGKIPSIKIGGLRFYNPRAVAAALNALSRGGVR